MNTSRPLTICYPFTGDVVGGSHYSAIGMIKALDHSRFRPLILPQRRDGAIAALFREQGLEIEASFSWTELPYNTPIGLRQFIGTIADIPAQVRFLRASGVDIVHTNDGRSHATWALPARAAGAQLLWHHRGAPTAVGLRLLAPAVANRVVTVSQFAMPKPGRWSAAARAEVVHSPFDTAIDEDRAAARAAILQEIGCAEGSWLIGYLGAYVDRKRPFLFIDAIAQLYRRHPALPVIGLMFGEDYDGTTEPALVAHAHHRGVSHLIRFMGFRRGGPYWLAGCDTLMIPAVGEPFGRTVIEAMLVGTPVVATASGGNVEALRDGALGTLVPPEDAVALGDACYRVFADRQHTANVVRKAAEDARTRFGIERHASRIMAIYGEMDRAGQRVPKLTPNQRISA